MAETTKLINALWNEGYLSASIDSTKIDATVATAFLKIGSKYEWLQLKANKANTQLLSRLGYNEKMYTRKPIKYTELVKLFEKTIRFYENTGYPFVTIKLDSITLVDNSISATINVDKNKYVQIDSVVIEGTAKISNRFLYQYLNVKPNMPYNEEVLKSIQKKINQLAFIQEKKTQLVRLTDKQNKLYLFLDKKNASQFDGIIGILPNDKGKTIFTGDVKIKLINGVFRAGETVDINWRRLQVQTQDLKARIIYPFIAGLPIGVDYGLKIYRKDTTFIDVNNNIGLQYYFEGLNNLKVFYKQRNTNLLSTSGYNTVTVLPEYADVVTQSYGLGVAYEKLDYRFNPRTGCVVNTTATVGNRIIKKNPKINEQAYNNVKLTTNQYQLETDLAAYLPLGARGTVKLAAQAGSILGNTTIFKNELMRIGGFKTLRGFDEESLYASTYIIPTLEYRFLFSQNSNIFLFSDGAWYENNSVNTYINDQPFSIGAGINFDTKAGIFSLSYALGKQFNNTLNLQTGKIHFGLVAIF